MYRRIYSFTFVTENLIERRPKFVYFFMNAWGKN